MRHTEDQFTGIGGTRLFTQAWLPTDAPKAHVTIVHGFGEHSSRYSHLVNHLLPKGYALSTYDQRGFGRSEGQRGYINSWGEYRGDLKLFVERVQREHPSVPHFIFGHSMGGLVTLDYLIRFPEGLRGAIISGPALGEPNVAGWMIAVSKLLSKVWPRFSLDTELDLPALTRDPEELREIENDPLRHSLGTTRFGTEFFATQDFVKANGRKLLLPVFMFHGGADRVVPASATQAFFSTVAAADKKLTVYEGGYHESINDIHRATVLADVEEWLEARLG